ncbi:MAG: hypothetical protein WDN06_08565 [Asticcacaulis sp.]
MTVSLPVLAAEGVEVELPFAEPEPETPAVKALEDYRQTPDSVSGFGDFVIRPPKS